MNNFKSKILIFAIIFVPITISLGLWQIERAEEKKLILANYDNLLVSAPVVLQKNQRLDNWQPLETTGISNTHSIGYVLYTDYIHLFQLSGMILLVAMIGAIILTYRKREGLKRQSYFSQISREKIDGVAAVISFERGTRAGNPRGDLLFSVTMTKSLRKLHQALQEEGL